MYYLGDGGAWGSTQFPSLYAHILISGVVVVGSLLPLHKLTFCGSGGWQFTPSPSIPMFQHKLSFDSSRGWREVYYSFISL